MHNSKPDPMGVPFSVATEVDPDILIIDEVLAVGDAHFKQKSRERILEFKNKGVIILFVSHNMEEVGNLCNQVLWLDHGRMKMIGDSETVTGGYLKVSL